MILRALIAKEIGTLFVSPVAYAVCAVFLLLAGYTFFVTLLVSKQASLVHIFFQSAMQLVLLIPLLTMRRSPKSAVRAPWSFSSPLRPLRSRSWSRNSRQP